MNDLKTKKIAITHSGRFHMDDVLSTAFIMYFNPKISIKRTKSYAGNPKKDEIVYDIGFREFDHHQAGVKRDEEGHSYSAFGLLWEKYGRDYLVENGFKKIEEAFSAFKKAYVNVINQGDNEGYINIKNLYENDMVLGCNVLWFENDSEEYADQQFEKAVQIGKVILKTWTLIIYKIHELYK